MTCCKLRCDVLWEEEGRMFDWSIVIHTRTRCLRRTDYGFVFPSVVTFFNRLRCVNSPTNEWPRSTRKTQLLLFCSLFFVYFFFFNFHYYTALRRYIIVIKIMRPTNHWDKTCTLGYGVNITFRGRFQHSDIIKKSKSTCLECWGTKTKQKKIQ